MQAPNYSHATTLLFNGDLSYDNDLRAQPKHPYGASLWFAAVSYPFSRIDVAQGHPIVTDRTAFQGSWTLFGMSFASLLAFAAGFILLVGSLSRMGVGMSRGQLWLLLVGAGLGGFWAHFNVLDSHAVEFLSVVCIIVAAAASGAKPRAARAASFFAPCAVAFALTVRPSNVGLLLLPLAVVWLQRVRGRAVKRSVRFGLAGWLCAGVLLMAGNMAFYGQPYPTLQGVYQVDLFRDAPVIVSDYDALSNGVVSVVKVVERPFSILAWYGQRALDIPSFLAHIGTTPEFGLLWWTPVLILGPIAAALLFFRGEARANNMSWTMRSVGFLAVTAVYAGPFAIVFLWQSYGSGWGFRYLLSAIPISLVLVFAYLERIPARLRAGIVRLLIVSALFSIASQIFAFTTAEFRPVPGAINSFGESTSNSLPALGFDVLRAILRPEAWAAAFAGRSTGFLGLQFLGETRAVGLVTAFGLDDAFRYSVDEALAIVRELPDGLRWAYNIAILAMPLLHLMLIRGFAKSAAQARSWSRRSALAFRRAIKSVRLTGSQRSAADVGP